MPAKDRPLFKGDALEKDKEHRRLQAKKEKRITMTDLANMRFQKIERSLDKEFRECE